METIWFVLLALMLMAYATLDGFDLGAGVVSGLVGRTHDERRLVQRTIGPVWDGNEVWLIATGGAMFFAFPLAYAASFSGFYLSLMIVLWLLMLRGIGIELRSHVTEPLWWSFFDFVFAISSGLLAFFFGVAIGNVVRGVPLTAEGYFFEPLWTDFRVGPHPGILDWYTLLIGALAFSTLTMHGANYVAMKTAGDVNARAHRLAAAAWIFVALFTILSLLATLWIRPEIVNNFDAHPWGWIIPAAVAGSLLTSRYWSSRLRDRPAFIGSTVFIAAMLGGAAFAQYPVILPATTNDAYSITIENAKTGEYSLRVGLIWWTVGIALAMCYFVFVYRSFRGKVRLEGE